MSKKNREIPADAQDAVAELQTNGFAPAKQAVEVARFILDREADAETEALVSSASQATRVPSSDTVQNPAAE